MSQKEKESFKFRRLMWLLISLIVIVAVSLSMRWFSPLNGKGKQIKGKGESFTPWVWKKIKVRAVGDFIPHGSVLKTASARKNFYDTLNFDGFRYLTEPVKHLFAESDINIVNFETPCYTSGEMENRSYVFNVPPAAIDALSHTGFNLFILANNHIYDYGREGLYSTLQEFASRDLVCTGAGRTRAYSRKPILYKIKDVRIAFWSFTEFVNDNYNDPDSSWVNIFDENRAYFDVSSWKDSADVTVITYHGGEEYSTVPLQKQIDIFHRLLEAGGDVIIGSHPHVVQPIEIYETQDGREAVIFYSLGNFIANQSRKYRHPVSPLEYGDTRDVPVADFTLALVDYGPLGKKWEIHDVGIIPCWIENNYYETLRGEPRSIRVVSIFRETAELDSVIDTLSVKIRAGKADQRDSSVLKKKIGEKRHYLNRLKRIKAIIGDEFLKRE